MGCSTSSECGRGGISFTAIIGMTGVQALLFDELEGCSSKVVEDELFDAFFEKFAEDGKPKKPQTLQEHDKQHHPHGFDPETMTCKFRDKMKKITPKDAVDLIYATSDVHMTGIEGIRDKECGTIVLAGDFMEKAKKQEHFKDAERWWDEKFLPWCEEHKDQSIVIIGGNCDKWLYYNRDKVEWPKNVHYLDDTETEVNGMRVYGTSWCPHNMNGAWEVDDEQLEEEFSKIPEGLDILVTHVPPKGEGLELDHDTEFDSHFGSEALTKAILEKKPKIVLCGHIHSGSHKPVKIGDSLVMNVSRIDDDRHEQSFHGRRIGVERTDNGIGFLVDMEDEGRIELGEKGEIPESVLALVGALKAARESIDFHIESGDYAPNKEKIGAAVEAIVAAREDLEGLSHPKKAAIEAAIKSLAASEESGYKKPMSHIGKMYKGDKGNYGGFKFSWEGGKDYKGGEKKPYSAYANKWGKYVDKWKGGMGIGELLASMGQEEAQAPTILSWDEKSIESSPFDEWGMPRKKKK